MMGTIGPTQDYGMMGAFKRLRQKQPQPPTGEMGMQAGSKPGQESSMQMLPQSVGAQNPFANYQIGQSAGHGMAQQVGQFHPGQIMGLGLGGGMASALRARRLRPMGGGMGGM